jgi:predicted dehydrogenase
MLNFAFVGCGNMAGWHASELLKLGEVRIAAVIDPNPAAMAAFKQKHCPAAAEYESLETLLLKAPVDLDAVVIVTPHTLHFQQAKLALDHGLHVLVEKPMVTSTPDAYELWRAVNRSGKKLGITFQSPYTANFGYLATARDAGTLGKVHAISGWISQNWAAQTADTWRQNPALSGGGFVCDTGAHLLNSVMWLMNDPVTEVSAVLDNLDRPVDITGSATLRFQNGAVASLTFAGSTPTFENSLTLFTDRYTIQTDAYGRKLEMYGPDRTAFDPQIAPTEGGTPHGNLVAALHGREPLRAPVRYGVLLSALMDAMYQSAGSGLTVKVAPVPAELG